MQKFENLMERLDHITQDVAELKKSLLIIQVRDAKKSEEAWKGLLVASDAISRKWKGPSAVEEIREQRSKAW